MNNLQLERTLRLLRRTGDKAVVVDPGSDEVFMLMNLDAYEDLLDEIDERGPFDGTDNEGTLTDKDDLTLSDALVDDFTETSSADEEQAPVEKLTPVVRRSMVDTEAEPLDFSESWPKKAVPSLKNEESLEDVPDEGEEEKFYLEPVE